MPIGTPDVDLSNEPTGAAPAAAPSSVAFTDESMFTPPGATAPVSWKEWTGSHVSRADHDKLNAELGRRASAEELIARAQQLDQQRSQQQAPRQTQYPQQPANDPLAGIRGKNFVGGDAVAAIAETFQKAQEGDRRAIAEYATAVNKLIADNARLVQQADKRISSFETARTSEQQNTQISGLTDGALTKAGIDVRSERFGPVADVLRKHAENHYYSFEPGEGQTRDQYNREFASRYAADFEAERAAFRQIERVLADQARAARFPARGGNATPTGTGVQRFMSPRERAAAHFLGRQSADT